MRALEDKVFGKSHLVAPYLFIESARFDALERSNPDSNHGEFATINGQAGLHKYRIKRQGQGRENQRAACWKRQARHLQYRVNLARNLSYPSASIRPIIIAIWAFSFHCATWNRLGRGCAYLLV